VGDIDRLLLKELGELGDSHDGDAMSFVFREVGLRMVKAGQKGRLKSSKSAALKAMCGTRVLGLVATNGL